MQNPNETPDSPQVDRFTDRLLNALANLDRYANGYEKREPEATKPAGEHPARTG